MDSILIQMDCRGKRLEAVYRAACNRMGWQVFVTMRANTESLLDLRRALTRTAFEFAGLAHSREYSIRSGIQDHAIPTVAALQFGEQLGQTMHHGTVSGH